MDEKKIKVEIYHDDLFAMYFGHSKNWGHWINKLNNEKDENERKVIMRLINKYKDNCKRISDLIMDHPKHGVE